MDPLCPCGSGMSLSGCCAPVIDDPRRATTAEQLMRSRYTAFATGRHNHLWVTWHPRTRPERVDAGVTPWNGLEILATSGGLPGDSQGTVEFRASHGASATHGPGTLHEVSRFARRAGRWFYVDGDVRRD